MSRRALALVAAVALIAVAAGWLAMRAAPGDPVGVDATPTPNTAHGTSRAGNELAAPVIDTTEAVDRAPVPIEPQDATGSVDVAAVPDAVGAPAEREPGVARGRVVDDVGAPVSVFLLTLTPSGPSNPGRRQIVKNVRDATGRFEVHDVTDGGWSVLASKFGTRATNPATIEMPADGEREHVFVMPREGQIAGRVLDASGTPFAKAAVKVQLLDAQRGWGGDRDQATSEADGRFELDVAPGHLRIVAEAEGAAVSEAVERTLAAGERLDGLTLTLRRGGTIEGVVRDTRGVPLANTLVSAAAFGEHDRRSRETISDTTGWFRFDGLNPGWMQLTAADLPKGSRFSAQVEVHDAQVVHVDLGGGQAGMILVSGIVRGREKTAGARITFTRSSDISSDVPDLISTAKTDASGRYELVLTVSGPYVATVVTDERLTLRRAVEIPAAPHTVVDFDLPAGRIAGRVLGRNGEPISGMFVNLEDTVSGDDSEQTSHAAQLTGAEGRFAFENVPAGTYRLRAGPWRTFGVDGARSALAEGVLDGIELASDAALEDLELRMQEPAILVVRVVDARGSPAAGAQVVWQTAGLRGLAKADSAGVARIEGLSAVQTKLFARAGTNAVAPESVVGLLAGRTTETTLQLGTGNVLHVRLVDPAGKVVGDEPVPPSIRVTGAGGVGWQDEQTAWGTGSSRHFGPLPDGEYDVWVKLRTLDVHHKVRVSGPAPQELVVVVPD